MQKHLTHGTNEIISKDFYLKKWHGGSRESNQIHSWDRLFSTLRTSYESTNNVLLKHNSTVFLIQIRMGIVLYQNYCVRYPLKWPTNK